MARVAYCRGGLVTWRDRATISMQGGEIRFPEGGEDRTALKLRARWAADTVARCLPWVRLAVAWSIEAQGTCSDGYTAEGAAGMAGYTAQGDDLIVVSAREIAFAELLHHEVWHVAERYLSDGAHQAVAAACRAHPTADELMSLPHEVRAEAYALWAAARDYAHPASLPPLPRDALSREQVFAAVYSGNFGREVVRVGARPCRD